MEMFFTSFYHAWSMIGLCGRQDKWEAAVVGVQTGAGTCMYSWGVERK
jgi:hypothetical protein